MKFYATLLAFAVNMMFIFAAIPIGISVRRQHAVTRETYQMIRDHKLQAEEKIASSLEPTAEASFETLQRDQHGDERRDRVPQTLELTEIQTSPVGGGGHMGSLDDPISEDTVRVENVEKKSSTRTRRILQATSNFEGKKGRQLSFKKGDLVEELKTNGNW